MQPNDGGIYYFLGNTTSHILHALPVYRKMGGTFITLSDKATTEVKLKYKINNVINLNNSPYRLKSFGWKVKSVHEYDYIDKRLNKTTDFLNNNAKVVIFYDLFDFDKSVRLINPKTIFLTHGNMLKSYMNQNDRLRKLDHYTYMAALGPYMKNQFITTDHIKPQKLVNLGVARTDEIVKYKNKIIIPSTFIDELGVNKNNPIVSYMPTFWGLSSVYKTGLELVRNFPKEYTLIFRPHPQTPEKLIRKYLHIISYKPNVIYAPQGKYKELDLVSIFKMSSVIIGDVSSVMLEAILSEKPLIFAFDENNIEDQLSNYRSIENVLNFSNKITINNAKSIKSILNQSIEKGVDTDIWGKTAKECFYSPDGDSTEQICKFISNLL